MKMISSTSITSTSGVTLISAIGARRPPLAARRRPPTLRAHQSQRSSPPAGALSSSRLKGRVQAIGKAVRAALRAGVDPHG
jgi:hypothetical protein